jgi:hypothetical protein
MQLAGDGAESSSIAVAHGPLPRTSRLTRATSPFLLRPRTSPRIAQSTRSLKILLARVPWAIAIFKHTVRRLHFGPPPLARLVETGLIT